MRTLQFGRKSGVCPGVPSERFSDGRLTRRAKQWHKSIIVKSEIIASMASLGLTMSFDPDEVQSALRKAWSLATASQWTARNPAAGQCNVTSLLIHELFGGDLLKTPLPAGDHFYNRINRRRVTGVGAGNQLSINSQGGLCSCAG